MPNILAIDTATQVGSVAWQDGDALTVLRLPAVRDHSRTLAEVVSRLVGPRLASVDAYALSVGPGSFTGLRVGLAFLKGLALVYRRPVIAVSTLEALIHEAGAPKLPVFAVLDARAGELFVRAPEVPEGLYPEAEVLPRLPAGPAILVGEPTASLRAALPAAEHWPSAGLAQAVLELARPRLVAGEGVDALTLRPTYGQPARVDRAQSVVDTPKPAP
ncbi:MAG: tRNA (adenosine(37)-N6)-threonylcarbamoyltransferase complex dimerization subunit type 1 TsaB [Myxococcota bacterium]